MKNKLRLKVTAQCDVFGSVARVHSLKVLDVRRNMYLEMLEYNDLETARSAMNKKALKYKKAGHEVEVIPYIN